MLTRLRAPHRLAAADAWVLIEVNFITDAIVAALNAGRYVPLVKRHRERDHRWTHVRQVFGECAREAGAAALLTFDRRHFDRAPTGVTMVEPHG